MKHTQKEQLSAKGATIQVYTEYFKNDYISLTDIARYKNTDEPRFVIQNWMRNRNTLEFIGLWEVLNNPNFNRVQFDTFRNEAGLNRFTMTPSKWKEYLLKGLTSEQLSFKYASEADMLNVALFNKRAAQWKEEHPDLKGKYTRLCKP